MKTFISNNPYMAMWDKVVNKYSGEYGPYFESYKAKTGMYEVIIIGRAGEGIWTTGELIGAAAIEKGKYCKVIFAMPGERRNTPARSFVRFADEKVHFPVSWIHSGDDVLILEEEFLKFSSPVLDFDVATVTQRMNPNGFCIVNSPKKPQELKGDIAGKLITVDASKISNEVLGSPFFMNMAVIGAYLGVRKFILIDEIKNAIKEFTNPRGHKIFQGKNGEMNIKALQAGYEAVKKF